LNYHASENPNLRGNIQRDTAGYKNNQAPEGERPKTIQQAIKTTKPQRQGGPRQYSRL